MNVFGKSGARFEVSVLHRNVGAFLHVYVANLSRSQEISEAELCGIL